MRYTRIHTNALVIAGFLFVLAILAFIFVDDKCLAGNIAMAAVGALAGSLSSFSDAADESGHKADLNGHSHKEGE